MKKPAPAPFVAAAPAAPGISPSFSSGFLSRWQRHLVSRMAEDHYAPPTPPPSQSTGPPPPADYALLVALRPTVPPDGADLDLWRQAEAFSLLPVPPRPHRYPYRNWPHTHKDESFNPSPSLRRLLADTEALKDLEHAEKLAVRVNTQRQRLDWKNKGSLWASLNHPLGYWTYLLHKRDHARAVAKDDRLAKAWEQSCAFSSLREARLIQLEEDALDEACRLAEAPHDGSEGELAQTSTPSFGSVVSCFARLCFVLTCKTRPHATHVP